MKMTEVLHRSLTEFDETEIYVRSPRKQVAKTIRDMGRKAVVAVAVRQINTKATAVLLEAGFGDPSAVVDSIEAPRVFDSEKIDSMRERAVYYAGHAVIGVGMMYDAYVTAADKLRDFSQHLNAHRLYGTHTTPKPAALPNNVIPLFPTANQG